MINIGDRKSLDPLCKLWVNLAKNRRYRKFVTELDIKEFLGRTENEGLTYLTRVLPLYGKKLLSSFSIEMEAGSPDSIWLEFGLRESPFLGTALRAAVGGDSEAVDCVLQMTQLFYKLEVDYDKETVEAFLTNFCKVDDTLLTIDFDSHRLLIERARALVARILGNYDPFDIRPCHGGGSTACRTANHEKWHLLRYYAKLDQEFSYPDYFFYSMTHLADEFEKLSGAVESNPMARICLVPKDSRGPRVISCEPAELLFIQQGLMRKLYAILETHPLTKGQLNFTDQSINRELAREGSAKDAYHWQDPGNGDPDIKVFDFKTRMATLDLSDASDRVSLELVKRIFPPNWFRALNACRSERTLLPYGRGIVELQKFAPMGSSCCFPVEALVFFAIAKAAIGMGRYSVKHDRASTSPVYVYGDDIIVPDGDVGAVIQGLEAVGLVVNRHKSFADGPFRESCGGAFHSYSDVTPILLRKIPCASSNSLATDIDFCNELIQKFGYNEVIPMIKVIEDAYEVPFPRSMMQLQCCIFAEPCASNDVYFKRRWNYRFQRFEHRIPQPYTRTFVWCEAAWSELLRKELTRESRSQADPDQYQHPLAKANARLDPGEYAESHSAQLKWRWTWLG